MGKRSDGFDRHPRDLYPTPFAAVPPLIPHLRKVRRRQITARGKLLRSSGVPEVQTFAEPCCGNGDLVRHLRRFDLRCVYAADIANGSDALATSDYRVPDAIITNPPYERELMHKLIAHFQAIAPTWLLMELDWAATKQAIPYMANCSDIVSIGRLRWIEGTTMNGKQNFAWYRFDRYAAGTRFHTGGRDGD